MTNDKKVGRPFTYDPEFHPQDLIERMAKGELNCEIFDAWNVHKTTFYDWRKQHEEFEEAFQIGLPKCEAFYVRRMRLNMLEGNDAGFKYCIAIMNNKFGWGKDDKAQGGKTTNIQINNNLAMLGLEGKSDKELFTYIKTQLASGVIDVESEEIKKLTQDLETDSEDEQK